MAIKRTPTTDSVPAAGAARRPRRTGTAHTTKNAAAPNTSSYEPELSLPVEEREVPPVAFDPEVSHEPEVSTPVSEPTLVAELTPVAKPTPVAEPIDQEAIARLAYSYWEARGCTGGSPEEDWVRAEQELRNPRANRASA